MKKTDAAIKIGQRIAQARKDSGIGSQAALAAACNWLNDVGLPSQGRVSNYESGSREAGFSEIQIIAAATSKDVSFFYSDDLSSLPNLGTFLAEKPTEHELSELLVYLRGMRVTK
ncbi:MAG: helix-turn-helix transcriptional regulator [Porticoccaceae bacterium]|nr:helix-turn-helix transcriptional regulator [Porticoccaceae bacterium]